MCEAIQQGLDVHTATAALIYNVEYADVTEDQRTAAKTVNFSLVYGQGDDASAAALKISVSEAKAFKRRYFNNLPEVNPFIQTVQEVVKQRGYVRNFYNRRRRLKSDEAYKATNALIQGWAADYIKSKMVLLYRYLTNGGFLSRILMVVHDEVIFEIHETEEHIVPVLRWLLSDFKLYRVPITAGVDVGCPDWGHKETVDCGFREPNEQELEWLGKTLLRV